MHPITARHLPRCPDVPVSRGPGLWSWACQSLELLSCLGIVIVWGSAASCCRALPVSTGPASTYIEFYATITIVLFHILRRSQPDSTIFFIRPFCASLRRRPLLLFFLCSFANLLLFVHFYCIFQAITLNITSQSGDIERRSKSSRDVNVAVRQWLSW